MNRRAFVTTAVGAIPLMAFGQPEIRSKPSHRGFVVSAGKGRLGKTLRLFDKSWIDFKITTADTAGAFFMLEQRDLGRFGPPRHVHPEQDEWFRPLKGTFRIEVGDDKFLIGPGDMLFAPRGVPHVWTHLETEPGGILVAFQPAGKMEAFFQEFTKFSAMPPMAEMRGLFRDHDMEIVGPPLPTV